jgi:hypothetical protein
MGNSTPAGDSVLSLAIIILLIIIGSPSTLALYFRFIRLPFPSQLPAIGPDTVAHACNSSYSVSVGKRIMVQDWPGKGKPLSKTN